MCPKFIELLSWNDPTVRVCCFMLSRASTKIFVSRIYIRKPSQKNSEKIFVSRKLRQQGHSLDEVSLYLPKLGNRIGAIEFFLTVLLCTWSQEFQLDIKCNIFNYDRDNYAPFNKILLKDTLRILPSLFAFARDKTKQLKHLEEQQVYTCIKYHQPVHCFTKLLLFSQFTFTVFLCQC